MDFTIANFDDAVAALPLDPPVPEQVTRTLKMILSILERDESWSGGCYMLTAIGHMLLTEQGINSVPCIGDCVSPLGPFDHAWLEVDGAVYDLPIAYPMEDFQRLPAVIGGLCSDGQTPPQLYGTDPRSYDGLDTLDETGARAILEPKTLSQVLDHIARLRSDLWPAVEGLCRHLKIQTPTAAIREKHLTTRWVVRDSVPIPAGMTRDWPRLH